MKRPLAIFAALLALAVCPSMARGEQWVSASRDSGEDGYGPILVMNLFHSEARQDAVIDYLPERKAFDVTHSTPLEVRDGCRRVERDRVRCRAFGGKETLLFFYGADRPTRVVIDDALRGYQLFQMGGMDDFVDASRRASTTDAMTGKGDDTYLGSANGDSISGDLGSDLLVGRSGSDILYGDGGRNILRAGRGNDVMHAKNRVGDLELNCGPGSADWIRFDLKLDPRGSGCEDRRHRT